MAQGAGRIPKHPSEKLGKDKPVVPPLKLPLVHDGAVPPLPKTFGWTPVGRAYWRTIWKSPMALTFIDADITALVRLTVLIELTTALEMNAAILSEVRQLEDRFGLSPLARRRLQFDIDRTKNQLKPESEREPEDDSRWLRVVDSA